MSPPYAVPADKHTGIKRERDFKLRHYPSCGSVLNANQQARKDRETRAHLPEGTLVAIAGGKNVTDANVVINRLDKAKAKYADIILVHGGGPGVAPLPQRHARARTRRRCRSHRRALLAQALRATLVAAALRAPPVSTSPFTGSRTAPCSRVRTSADTAAGATADVLRTTPCSSRCTSRRSSAAAAPMSRCRRPRFPER